MNSAYVLQTNRQRAKHIRRLLVALTTGAYSLFVLFILVGAECTAQAATLTVPAGGNFQAALNAALPGDTIVLEAGATYTGPFTLPVKSPTSTDYITIQSSRLAELPADGQRVSPQHAALMPKLVSPGGGDVAISTEAAAHHYRFIGIEVRPRDAQAVVYDLVLLGNNTSAQNTLASVPHHLDFDRCYMHGWADGTLKRGVALNSAHTSITNSYISECKGQGQDTQAIAGDNGPGPFKIINNYLEGAGENVIFGGSTPNLRDVVPSDIEIRRNHFYKPLAWRGVWTVKNLFELKNAQRVVVSGNVFENNWGGGQDGSAILFTVRDENGNAPWARIHDVEFINNIVRHSGQGINAYGSEGQGTRRITVRNNLFEDIDGARWSSSGKFLVITGGTVDVKVDHNTILHSGNITAAGYAAHSGFAFTNNIARHNEYGFQGDNTIGNSTFSTFFPGADVRRNVIPGAATSNNPVGNYYPASLNDVGFVDLAGGNYRLAANSPYKGQATDGKDVGCDFDALEAAMSGGTPPPPPPPPPTNTPPTVSITSPASGATYTAPATVTITANASDGDGTISKVEFYDGATLIHTENYEPYDFTYTFAQGSHSLTAKATDNAGATTTSSAVSITVGSNGGSLPSPWTSRDIGSTGQAGSASYSNGVYTVRGAGADIWGTSDAFHYVHQPLNGDGEIVARVASMQNTDASAKAGVMIREALTADARHAILDVKPGGGIEFMSRAATGGTTSYLAGSNSAFPAWLKLVRQGTTFTAYRSADGASWVQVGSTTVTMAASVHVGLVVLSHNTSALNTTTFDNVSATTLQSSSFSDDFNDNVRDTAKWNIGVLTNQGWYGALTTVAEQNQRLEVKPRTDRDVRSFNGYVSAATHNLSGTRTVVELVQMIRDAQAHLGIGINDSNWYRFTAETHGGIDVVEFSSTVAGVYAAHGRIDGAASNRFWGIRHDVAADQIVFETKLNASSPWVERVRIPRGFALTNAKIEIKAGTYHIPQAGTVAFDNFRIER